MQNCVYALSVNAILVALVIAVARADDKEPILSVDETVELATRQFRDRVPQEYFEKVQRANPNARNKLYAILADANEKRKWPSTVAFFAYIGQAEDVPTLIAHATQIDGVVEGAERATLYRLFDALGGMAARGVDGAKEALEQMIRPEYWDDKNIRLYATTPKDYPSSSRMLALKAMFGYAYLNDPKVPEKAQELLSGLKGNERAVVEQEIVGVMAFWEDRKTMRWLRGNPDRSGEPAAAVAVKNGDPQNHREPPTSMVDADPEDLVAESLVAYKEISDALLRGDANKFAEHVADNMKPMLPPNIRTDQEVTKLVASLHANSKSMEMTVKIARAMNAIGVNYTEATVTEQYTVTDQNDMALSRVDVIIPCNGSERIRKDFLSDHPRGEGTIHADGRLCIYMIMVDGEWYWNPFGW